MSSPQRVHTGHPARVVVVMGVSGTGKSTLGALLATELGVPYAEADTFHPAPNIAKMSAGTPLDDADREPWLDAIAAWARSRRTGARARGDVTGVVSCSALKRRYRDRLRATTAHLFFLHLTAEQAVVAERLAGRHGHFMPSALLDSQYAALEPLQGDERGVQLPVTAEPKELVARAIDAIDPAPGQAG